MTYFDIIAYVVASITSAVMTVHGITADLFWRRHVYGRASVRDKQRYLSPIITVTR